MPPATAHLTVDLGALRANWRLLAQKSAPAECAAVIKADAYGVGLEQAARALWSEGARSFFVARAGEGARARAVLPEANIFVLDGLAPGSAQYLRAHNLIPVLGALEEIAEWNGAGPAALHIDTGMRRLGIDPADCARALAMLGASPVLAISHFTSSEYPDAPANAAQIEAFAALAAQLPDIRLSLCNSSGIFLSQPPVHQLTRPGVALYGGNPTPHLKNPMQPVVSLHAPILLTREAPVGAVVGYNGVWTARRPTRIAIVGIGYADGLLRSAMGTDDRPGPKVMVGDVACHIIGRISMDLTAIDVTDAAPEHARRGARVEFFGSRLSVDDLAASAGTISYEILTGLSKRYARVYSGA